MTDNRLMMVFDQIPILLTPVVMPIEMDIGIGFLKNGITCM